MLLTDQVPSSAHSLERVVVTADQLARKQRRDRRSGLSRHLRCTRNRRQLLLALRLRTWTGQDWLHDAAKRWAAELKPAEVLDHQRRLLRLAAKMPLPEPDPIETEQRVLGALLRDPERHEICTLEASDFTEPLHAGIFVATRVLRALGRPTTASAVAEYAEEFGHLGLFSKAGDKVTWLELFVAERWTVPGYILFLEERF